jgi:UDP-N-acetylglucosamine--N-acetylmuramyl-(pentapeptide) pyrophosphoryl-undecaprenol N-acetylglucosamine transferase
MRHLVVMAAGTGGHVYPGLAVAREMQGRGWRVSWLGTEHGMENRLVPPSTESGIEMDRLRFAGLRGKSVAQTALNAWRLLGALWKSATVLRRRGADAVLGMGGYVCLPGGLMAALLRRPLVLVNADAGLLLSNRSLLPWADRVAFGFDGPAVNQVRQAVVTGNPVRAEIEAIAPPSQRFAGRSGPLRLLVVGGSLGARVINQTLPQALAKLTPDERPTVLHQTGETHLAEVQRGYAEAGLVLGDALQVRPFIHDMAEQLAACDLVICRAGALTVSELCAAGVPAVLVPLIVSTTAHQRDNAEWMARHGAAVHLPQSELSADQLAQTLRGVSRVGLLAMAVRARNLAMPQAAARVADEIERLVPEDRA